MFNCDLCYYSTDRSSNLKQHNASKKHIIRAFHESKNNINDNNEPCIKDDVQICQPIKKSEIIPIIEINDESFQHLCKMCQRTYSCRQNLWRHQQTQNCKPSAEILQINMFKQQMAQMEEKINLLMSAQTQQSINNLIGSHNTNTQLTNANNMTNIQNTVVKNIAENVTETNNNQKIVVYQFVNQNYTETEPIKMLEPKDAKKLLTVKDTKHTMADFIVHHYDKYNLDDFLGEIIIGAYKKEDPKKQQIWLSNVMKLIFIVRQILNKENVWLKDINGVCITKHIIDPFLKEIKSMLQKYVKICAKTEGKNCDQLEEDQCKGMSAVKIIREINEKKLHQKILKCIAPEFQLQQHDNKIIQIKDKPKRPTKKILKDK